MLTYLYGSTGVDLFLVQPVPLLAALVLQYAQTHLLQRAYILTNT